MLKYENLEDREKMLNYHRTKDMINLLNFFPDLSPIRNLTIVTTIEDYNANYDYLKKLPCERNDTLITKPMMKSVEGSGINTDIVSTFKKVKDIDSDGVMVLFDLCHEPSERYARYAGISVAVSLGVGVFIDAVGKGFDGREVSKGICSHERYFIPWFELRSCHLENFKKYRTFLISDSEYAITRFYRIEFLKSVNLSEEVVTKYIPEKYQEIPYFIWLDVIRKLIKKLEKMEEELYSYGFSEFAISGHTEGKNFCPWQLFDESRYTLAKKKLYE